MGTPLVLCLNGRALSSVCGEWEACATEVHRVPKRDARVDVELSYLGFRLRAA
jgi:hypothetical protein